jgi:hypothetical protein
MLKPNAASVSLRPETRDNIDAALSSDSPSTPEMGNADNSPSGCRPFRMD